MPSGIILSSGSQGATQEAIEKVLTDHGYEADKPEAEATELKEPKREDFASDEDFEEAEEAFAEAQAAQDEEEKKERERERLEGLPKPSRRQRAIEKATKPLREEIQKLQDQVRDLAKKSPAAKPVELKEPKREDFPSDEKYEEALFDYRYKLRRAKEDGEEAQKAISEHLKENVRNYAAQKDKIKTEYADWDELMEKFGDSQISETVYITILGLEEGPRVAYYLAQHPDQLDKLNALFPDAAQRELIRLHDRLTGSPRRSAAERDTKPKPKPRQIPEPVRPVSTAATNSTLSSREAAQKRDYRAFKAAQRRGA